MNLNQQELQAAGESGRSAGYHFEDVIKDEINNKTPTGIKIIDYILNNESIKNNNLQISAIKTPKSVEDMIGNRNIPPKADIFLIIRDNANILINEIGISIKSSPASIQVQITNVDRFRKVCEYYNLEFSDNLYIALAKFCGWEQYKPTDAEKVSLKQGHRDRWLFQELTQSEQNEIKNFFSNNEKEVISIVLQKGSSNLKYFANYYIVNKVAYAKTPEIDICIKDIDSVIQDSATGFQETVQGSFHIGKITAQMKGSGTGKAYHGFQLNKKGC